MPPFTLNLGPPSVRRLALVLFLVAAEAVGVAGLVAVVETPQVHPLENHPQGIPVKKVPHYHDVIFHEVL